MANVFDYLQWRGDLLFSQDGFHTVDALILSRLSYIQLDGILGENESLTVRKAAEQFFADETRAEQVLWKGDAELLRAVAESARFGDLVLSDYVNIVDGETKMQFSAVVIDVFSPIAGPTTPLSAGRRILRCSRNSLCPLK